MTDDYSPIVLISWSWFDDDTQSVVSLSIQAIEPYPGTLVDLLNNNMAFNIVANFNY